MYKLYVFFLLPNNPLTHTHKKNGSHATVSKIAFRHPESDNSNNSTEVKEGVIVISAIRLSQSHGC